MNENAISTNDDNKLLKVSDVARNLNISRSMAYRLMQRGDITRVNIGRAVRVRPVDLEEFIDKHLSGWNTTKK